jgi:hypothetical protein
MIADEKASPRLNQLANSIIGIATGEIYDREPTPGEQGKDSAAVALARKGSQARADKLSDAKRKAIAQKASQARWAKKHSP